MRKRSWFECFRLVPLLALVACGGSDGGGSSDPAAGGAGTIGAGGSTVPLQGAGGVSSPGGTSGGGAAGAAVVDVPPGQLSCGGKLCHAGGHCSTKGECPAFLGACFTGTDAQTCETYCKGQGFACAAKACNGDGSPNEQLGYSWVSFPAARKAECGGAALPPKSSFDECVTPIWLAASMPKDDVVRCCCKDL